MNAKVFQINIIIMIKVIKCYDIYHLKVNRLCLTEEFIAFLKNKTDR